ncbi:MAG TPA: c-type cytochrome [Rhodocyclaceae bacterium]
MSAFSQFSIAGDFDEKAAKKTIKNNDCGKCHAEKKTKKGPSYKKTAADYAGKADAYAKISKHLREEPMVKLEDGTEEKHKAIEVENEAELMNLVNYILAQ